MLTPSGVDTASCTAKVFSYYYYEKFSVITTMFLKLFSLSLCVCMCTLFLTFLISCVQILNRVKLAECTKKLITLRYFICNF